MATDFGADEEVVNVVGTPLRDEDAANKLEVIIYNLLSIGAWEASRGQLLVLAELDNGRKKAKDILKSIILNPRSFWNESSSVPSTDHLALLALQAYLEIFPGNADEIPTALEGQFQFHLLLHATRKYDGYNPQISDWLKGYYSSYIVGTSSLTIIPLHAFDSSIKNFLRSVLLTNPSLAHTLLLYLTIKENPKYSNYLSNNEILQSLYIDCIEIYWSELEKLYSVEDSQEKINLINKIHLMLSLINPQPDMNRLLTKLDNLLLKLLQSDIKDGGSLVFTFESIYSCFVGRTLPTLIQRLHDIEEHVRVSGDVRKEDEIVSDHKKWKDEFYRTLKERQHFLERTMDTGLRLISSGQLDELFKLIQDSTYSHLKPLLLLIGWDRYPDIGSGQKLLDTLMPQSHFTDPLLYSGCCKLAFQVGLVQWCLQKAKPFLPVSSTSLPSTAGDVFQGLKNHSVLYVLHHSTPLSSLDPLEVIDILKVRPDSSLTAPLSPPSHVSEAPSSFRNGGISPQLTLQPEQERDINTFRGFCCLRLIQDAIWYSILHANGLQPPVGESPSDKPLVQAAQKAEGPSEKPAAARKLDLGPSKETSKGNEKEEQPAKVTLDTFYAREVTERLTSARGHLSQIFPLHFRLEILENIFSLLFLSSDDILPPEEVKGHTSLSDSTHSSTSQSSNDSVLSDSSSIVFIKKQKGFLLSEAIASDIIVLLNDCMFEFQAAKFSLHSSPAKDKEHMTTLSSGVILSSISPSLLPQRSTKLQKQINEAKWRLELVSSKGSFSGSTHQGGVSSGEESASDASDHEDEAKTESVGPPRKTRSKDLPFFPQEVFRGPSPTVTKPSESHQSRLLKSRSASSESNKKGNGEKVATPSVDETYESSGHCADVEEPLSLSLAKKKRFRPRLPSSSSKSKKTKYLLVQKGSGIIYQMFASPNSLLCKCLKYRNYHKAREVIKMFNMEDTIGNSLVQFSEQFEEVSKDLVVHCAGSTPRPSPELSRSGATGNDSMALQVAVLNASDKNPALESLHRLLVPTNLSKMLFAGNEELNHAPTSEIPLLLSLTENVPSLVMLDLLVSNNVKGQIAKRVINMAVGRSKTTLEGLPPKDSLVGGRRSFQDRSNGQEKPLQGPLGLLHTLSEVSGYFIMTAPSDFISLTISSPHILFTNYLLPLTIESIQNWKEFNDTYQERRGLVDAMVTQGSTHKDILTLLSGGTGALPIRKEGSVFEKLLQSMRLFPRHEAAVSGQESIRYIYYLSAYLLKFVNLLKNSLNLASDQVPDQMLLSVLYQSPTNLIGRLVFEKSISPQRLEQFMSDLPHLKIVEVIVKCCCPSIPSFVSPFPLSKTFASCTIVPLNIDSDVGGASNGNDETDPCQLSHKLFNKMIATLKGLSQNDQGHIDIQDLLAAAKTTEMKKIFACTSKLASISLESLRSDSSKQIAFFSNVTNLLYAHALMVLVQESLDHEVFTRGITLNALQSDKVAQLSYFSHVGYLVGELGLVSLYDLHYIILRHGLSQPVLDKNHKLTLSSSLETYDPWLGHTPMQPDPRVLYAISNGTLSSPVPRLLLPEHVHSELDSAETKYLRTNVSFDIGKLTMKIPKLLDEHRNDFIPRKCWFEPGNPFRHLSNIALARYISSKLPKELADQLSALVDTCDVNRTSFKRGEVNELIVEVTEDDLTIGYDFPSSRRTTSFGEGASPQLPRRRDHPSSRKHPRRYEKLKPYTFTDETMDFVQDQAPLLASIVSLLCPPKHLKEETQLSPMSNEFLDSFQQPPQKETKKAFIETFHIRRPMKMRQIPEVKRSHSISDESKVVFPRPSPVWQETFDKLLELFVPGSPLRNYFSVRAECFKGVLPWDSSVQESPNEVTDSINLRKLIMLPGNSSDIGHACSFVLRKLLRHGLVHEALQFLRAEPMINNSYNVQHISNLVCSTGLLNKVNERDTESSNGRKDEEISRQFDPLVLVRCHDNKELMARLVLSSLHIWSVTTCVNLLMYISCHLPAHSLFLPLVNRHLQQLYVYQKIIELVQKSESQVLWSHWSGLSKDSKENPQKVVTVLLKHREFNLAREWNKVHKNVNEIIAQIEEEYIYNLLEGMDESDPYTAQSVLEDLPLQSMKQQVCENLLERCFNLESLMLILQFLLGRLSFQIPSQEKIKQLTNQFLGVKALLALPHFIRDQYRRLMREPLLIIEQLLIDLKIEWAGKIIKELTSDEYISEIDRNDTPPIDTSVRNYDLTNPFTSLLMYYSEKALEFPLPKKVDISSRAASPSIPPTPFSRPYERMRSPSQSPSIPPTPNRFKKGRNGNTTDRGKYFRFEPPPHPPKKEDWVSDTKYCQVCNSTYFGMFSRRHHCRRCGRVACGSCSAYFLNVEGYDRQQRACLDCYNYHQLIIGSSDEHTFSDQEDRPTMSPTHLISQFPWQLLPGDAHYNQNLRTEFYYNDTPSTPLCLAIIDLMVDLKMAAGFILHCCHNVSIQLVPDELGMVNEEIDHYFTISIMENLLLNAKLRFIQAEDSSGVELCDTYLSHVDLLRLLVSSRYSEIPSIQELTRPELARRVRDKLIADDRYELAIEVSTKCQLDPSAVWTAWGMACIKAGEYKLARDKFRHCLQMGNQSSGGGAYLLERIIEQILSCPLASVKGSDDWSELVSNTLALSEQPHDTAFVTSRRFGECCYYLKNYGTVGSLIGFFAQHQCWLQACQEANSKQCSEDVFVNQLWLHALKLGQLEQLEESLVSVDPSLVSWERHLTAVCRFLSQRKLFHILYRMQIFMKDYVRAAMTCIKFYIGFSGRDTTIEDLYLRKKYLHTAQEHFQSAIEARQPKGKKFGATSRQFEDFTRGTRSMSVADLQTHIHTICLQLSVTDLLYKAAVANNTLTKPLPVASSSTAQEGGAQPVTLFSTGLVRGEVTCLILTSCQEITEGFQTAYEMISVYRLPTIRVFTDVARQLAMQERYTDLRLLVQCIQKSSLASDELNDEVCMAAIKVLANQTKEARAMDKNLDKLIAMLRSNKNKIKGLIQCGKLKNAYLVAIKSKLPEEVEHIADVAAKAGQITVRDICEKWLQQYRANKLS